SSNFGNPLGGRDAWSGDSGGYTNVSVNLPSSAVGQTTQLRWRLGADNSYAGIGSTNWRIDTINLCAAWGVLCLKTDVNASAITSSNKLSLGAQLTQASQYIALGSGGHSGACASMSQFRSTSISNSATDSALAAAIAGPSGWTARIDASKTAYAC